MGTSLSKDGWQDVNLVVRMQFTDAAEGMQRTKSCKIIHQDIRVTIEEHFHAGDKIYCIRGWGHSVTQ